MSVILYFHSFKDDVFTFTDVAVPKVGDFVRVVSATSAYFKSPNFAWEQVCSEMERLKGGTDEK